MAPPRATWKGHVKLSLVSFAVRVHNATSSASKVGLNQLHKDCHHRLKQKMACPEHGDVDRSEIVKGYEYEKGKYVIVEPEDLENIQLETTKTIELAQFVDREQVDPIYLSAPYYVAPDGPVAQEAFTVMREAMQRAGKVAIGRFVVAGRERVVIMEPDGKGFRMTTLRAREEVRESTEYFSDIADVEINDAHLKMAEQLIEASSADLDTAIFRDRYQEAMLDMIKNKIDGADPVVVEQAEVAPSLNFMDALSQSISEASSRKKKPPAKSVKKSAKTSRKKASG